MLHAMIMLTFGRFFKINANGTGTVPKKSGPQRAIQTLRRDKQWLLGRSSGRSGVAENVIWMSKSSFFGWKTS